MEPSMTEQTGKQDNLVLAADLGGTHLRVALVDESGRIHKQLKKESPQGVSPQCVIEAFYKAALECGCFGDRVEGRVVAAAIMVPGTIDKNNVSVVQAPNMTALNNFELKPALEKRLGWPVVLENDANAAAVGEMWLGAARGCRNVICVTLGTGVGGGIILDGKLWRGTDGSAGEIGHTTVDPFGGVQCKCGGTGCLEMFASATAIVRMANELLPEFPDSTLRNVELSAEKVYEAGESGDRLAVLVFEKVGTYLGVGLANLVNLLNPEVIVIGGGVANGWDLFANHMNQQVQQRAFPLAQRVKIIAAERGDNAGLLGAARLAFDKLQNPDASVV
jgi:glucokinase